jgi:serine/threonine protein phosphatase PrpC
MGIILEADGITDMGLERDHNEDTFRMLIDYNLFMVADGMGGHNAGDVASRVAVDTVAEFFRHTESEDATWPFHFDTNLTFEENRMIGGIQMANRSILHQSTMNPSHEGMGTTIVALCFSRTMPIAYLGHVGDSRCYRIKGKDIRQLTRDHSLLSDFMQAMPDISEDKIQSIPKNIITRALGMQPFVEIDMTRISVEKGDLYLLCSDGLSGSSSDREILQEIEAANGALAKACQLLVELAKRKGGEDNITVVLAHVRDITPEEPEEIVTGRDSYEP